MRSRRPRPDWQLFVGVALLVLLCDQLSKELVEVGLFAGEYLGGILRVTHIDNPGAAFGLFPGARTGLIFIKVFALGTILVLLARGQVGRGTALTVAMALIFGGAMGNLLDRFSNGGEVVDFIDLGVGDWRWYIFNIADAAISVGAALLVLGLLRHSSPRDETA